MSQGYPSVKFRLLCVLSVCSLVLAGCGDSGRERIEGTVTLDGQLLEKGTINFLPLPGTQSPTAGAEIARGKFRIPARGGTFVGKFRVEITASRPSGKKVPDRWTGQPIDAYEQFLPVKYNTKSELEIEAKAGAANRFEFALESE